MQIVVRNRTFATRQTPIKCCPDNKACTNMHTANPTHAHFAQPIPEINPWPYSNMSDKLTQQPSYTLNVIQRLASRLFLFQLVSINGPQFVSYLCRRLIYSDFKYPLQTRTTSQCHTTALYANLKSAWEGVYISYLLHNFTLRLHKVSR